MTPKHFTHNNKYDNSEQGELFVFFVFFKIRVSEGEEMQQMLW